MKKLFAILIILFLPVWVCGQSKESNKLYKKGVKLHNADKYEEALPYFQKSDSLDKAQLKPTHKNYYRAELALANSYEWLADQADNEGHYKEALNLQKNVVGIRKKVLGDTHPKYALSLSDLAYYNYELGNYTEAIRFETLAIKIKKKALGEEHPSYAISLSNLATYNDDLGNYAETIRLETLAMEIRKKALGEEHPDYALSLSNLATYYYELDNYTEAIRHATLAMEIRKKALGEEHPDYANSLNNLAFYNDELGNYTEALRLETLAMEIWKNVFGEEHPKYALSLSNLAGYYSELGNYTEAIKLANQALQIYKKALGEGHPDYTLSLSQLAYFNLIIGNYDAAADYYSQCYHCLNSFILKTFSSMTSKERYDFWKANSDLFTSDLPYAAYKISSTPVETSYYGVSTKNDINAIAYDALIFSKGLLLNAELEIQKLIEQSGDTVFANRYYIIKNYRAILDELYQTSPEKREMNADSLAKVIDREEHLLVQSSKALGDYTKNLSISWRDVQKNLKDNELAIEFTTVEDTVAKKLVYIAFVLKTEMTAPELVRLDYSETDTINYTTPILYNKIWKPLENHLQGVQNVYFSPTDKFHNIGIEYLPDENGEIFAKKYSAYRLSSTRELALEHTVNPNKKGFVYGGIVYNFDESDWQKVEEDSERGGESLNFLKGSKKEADEITVILSEGSFDVKQGTDKAATEESFKKLSGSGIKILHIATHGFYEPENKENSFANMLSVGDKDSQEDRSMSRSGLFFAGANTALNPEQRKYIPEGVDDGILTAKEISRMDFKGLDLVVLSACNTGLGEVTSEGVFGLQRGFKKAGAQTIIMSLWNVNDKPTRDLMTEFYRNLVAGKTKREAFISAQDKIRQKYIHPKMWAGFIMVDGIEY